jgi:hypothetical protein
MHGRTTRCAAITRHNISRIPVTISTGHAGRRRSPILIVNGGSVGLYVDNGTDGHFRNLRVRVAVI